MPVPGTMGKVLMVDLSTQQITIETPSDDLYLNYLGGYGLGAYYLYKLQEPGVDPLGPENHLGFFTGVLTGTPGITSNRYVVVAKSPKTGTWGDANSGGFFGYEPSGPGSGAGPRRPPPAGHRRPARWRWDLTNRQQASREGRCLRGCTIGVVSAASGAA